MHAQKKPSDSTVSQAKQLCMHTPEQRTRKSLQNSSPWPFTAALMLHLCQCTLKSPLPCSMFCTVLIASKQIKYMTKLLERQGEKKGQRNRFLASLVASITIPNFSSQDGLLGHSLAVTGQAKIAHKVNETSSEIPPPAIFTR